MKSPCHAFLIVLVLIFIGIVPLRAQTPSIVVALKLFDYRQTSAIEQAIGTPSYGIRATFATPVPESTVVQLVGPVTLTIPRVSGILYDLARGYSLEAALDVALPDGNYVLLVAGGGAATSTPVVISSRPRFQPPLITNFDELQAVSTGTFRMTWQPIAGGALDDTIIVNGFRGATEVFSSPRANQPGILNGRSTSYSVNDIDIVPGETLVTNLSLVRYFLSSANAGATGIASGFGFNLGFPIKRLALAPPAIASQPQSITVAVGASAVFNVEATGTGLTYQWRKDAAIIPGATGAALILNGAQPGNAGLYSVVATNSAGSATSANAALAVVASTAPSRIVNLAIRTTSGSGSQTLIVGFVIGGDGTDGAKPLLVRAAGPSLGAFGVPGVLSDPRLELFSSTSRIAENDNWGGDAQVAAVSTNVGAFALGSATSNDAALYSPTLARAAYTAQVSGVGGTSGVVLAEVYDASPAASFGATTPRLINVSARSTVGTGVNLLIAGFVIAGPTARTVLIRGLGPGLAVFGVGGTLPDPRLTLFNGSNRLLENDDWGGASALVEAFRSVGAFPIAGSSRDAAMLVTLPPGSYTAQVSGTNNTTGVALVEVYEVP